MSTSLAQLKSSAPACPKLLRRLIELVVKSTMEVGSTFEVSDLHEIEVKFDGQTVRITNYKQFGARPKSQIY